MTGREGSRAAVRLWWVLALVSSDALAIGITQAPLDAGASDAGTPDAGTADAGSREAGPQDGGADRNPIVDVGCGCHPGGTTQPIGLLLLLLMLVLGIRRPGHHGTEVASSVAQRLWDAHGIQHVTVQPEAPPPQ